MNLLKWIGGFFEDGPTSSPSSKRLINIATYAVILAVFLLLAGLAAGLCVHLYGDDRLKALGLLLDTLKTLAGLALTGGGATYLIGKHIETRNAAQGDSQ